MARLLPKFNIGKGRRGLMIRVDNGTVGYEFGIWIDELSMRRSLKLSGGVRRRTGTGILLPWACEALISRTASM